MGKRIKMTAYELAEKAQGLAYEIPADWSSGEPKNVATDIANMLRQQADRIAELEKQGEPVAWIRSGDDQLSLVKEKDDGYMVWKPLYLAPQTKPLSDEEIDKIIYSVDWAYDPVLLARAIQERHGIK